MYMTRNSTQRKPSIYATRDISGSSQEVKSTSRYVTGQLDNFFSSFFLLELSDSSTMTIHRTKLLHTGPRRAVLLPRSPLFSVSFLTKERHRAGADARQRCGIEKAETLLTCNTAEMKNQLKPLQKAKAMINRSMAPAQPRFRAANKIPRGVPMNSITSAEGQTSLPMSNKINFFSGASD